MSTDEKDASAEVSETTKVPRAPATLCEEALALTREQRLHLVYELLDSLDDAGDDDESAGEPHQLSPAWEAEIERRVKAYDAGLAKTVPWSEVRASLRATLNKYRGR